MACSASRPHILVLFPDQLRGDSLSITGHPVFRTPNIDRLGREGVLFRNHFTTSPLCGPARHTLVKGLYPHNSNCWMDPDCMEGGADTVMQRLRTAGYRTCLVGKAHFYQQENVDLKPFERFMHGLGFEDLFETGGSWSNVGADTIYDDYLRAQGNGLATRLYEYYRYLDRLSDVERRFLAEPSPLPTEHVLDSFIGRTAVDYIRDYDDDRPSFLFVGFQGPHEPWDAPEPYASMYDPDTMPDPVPELPLGEHLSAAARNYACYAQYFQPDDPRKIKEVRANYGGKITLIDDWVGRILAAYEERGWLDNTVVILACDHGDMLGDLNRISKSMFFENCIRVPLIIRAPAASAPGRVFDGFVELVDLYPTLLETAGLPVPPYRDGISLLPVLRGEADHVRDDVLGEVHVHTMLRTERWKLVLSSAGDTVQLFDLVADPLEQRNLAGHPDCRDAEGALRDRLLRRLLGSQHHSTAFDPGFSAHMSVTADG